MQSHAHQCCHLRKYIAQISIITQMQIQPQMQVQTTQTLQNAWKQQFEKDYRLAIAATHCECSKFTLKGYMEADSKMLPYAATDLTT